MWCNIRSSFTSLECISDEVHLPLWPRNSKYPFVVEAWETHALHIALCSQMPDIPYAGRRAHTHKQALPPTHSHCPKLPPAWLICYIIKTDSPWRFMKRMQLSTTTGICCPELWRRQTSRGGELSGERSVRVRRRGQTEMQRKRSA